ncbi:MAG TPA: serine/threonine-protein kinase, partial [Pyrinomonadaceae bacterium]|nr:serine/threonine-protein kinase [Pyrinomonadaceae bacterium]
MKECPVCRRCFPDQVNHCPTDGEALKLTINGEPLLDGRYQLECRLGQGGMGLVYKARHIFLKTLHAIKIILPDLVGNDPSLVTRFRQEAMAAAAIRHPNIVAVTDFGVVGGTTPFLVMEFIQGKSLNDILQEQGKVTPEFAAELMTGVCSGLSAAHRQGIIHRDLKPLNIMLREDAGSVTESVKLLDFGLAKIKSGELLGSFVAAQTTGLMGSPFYMAPEQWGEEEPDRRADVYSLGVILYQMLAGEVPYRGPSIPAIMKKHLTGEPPPLAGRNEGVTPEVERVVLRALAKDPEARPQTVEAFVSELRSAVGLNSSGGADLGSVSLGSVLRTPGMDTIAIPRRPDTMHGQQETGGNFGGTVASAEGGLAPHTIGAHPHTEAQMPAPPRQRDARPTTPIDAGLRPRSDEAGRRLGNETAYAPHGDGATEFGESSWAPTEVLPSVEDVTGVPQGSTTATSATPETQVIDPRLVERKRQELLDAERRDAEEERRRQGVQTHAHPGAQTPAWPSGGQRQQTTPGQQTVAGEFGLTREILPGETIAPSAFDSQPTVPQQPRSQVSPTHAAGETASTEPRFEASADSLAPPHGGRAATPHVTTHMPPPASGGSALKYALVGLVVLLLLG